MSQVNSDNYADKAGTGAPMFPFGMNPSDTATSEAITFFKQENFLLDNDFATNLTMTATRINNFVNICSKGDPGISPTTSTAVSLAVVPELYRPTGQNAWNVPIFGGSNIVKIAVYQTGVIQASGQLFAGGASTIGAVGSKLSWSYTVD